MENLIQALQIILKYGNPEYPTYSNDGTLYINDEIDPDKITYEDLKKLNELGFFVYCNDDNCDKVEEQYCECEGKQLASYRFGSN